MVHYLLSFTFVFLSPRFLVFSRPHLSMCYLLLTFADVDIFVCSNVYFIRFGRLVAKDSSDVDWVYVIMSVGSMTLLSSLLHNNAGRGGGLTTMFS